MCKDRTPQILPTAPGPIMLALRQMIADMLKNLGPTILPLILNLLVSKVEPKSETQA